MPEIALQNEPKEKLGIDPSRLQSEDRREIAHKAVFRFYEMRTARDQTFSFFRERTLKDYMEDSLKRINQHKERPAYKKWWQSNLSGATTRNKLIGILSKLAANTIESMVLAVSASDFLAKIKERVSNALLKASTIRNKDDKKLIWEMFEASSKGTTIGFEGFKIDERKVRTIIKEDFKTGEVQVKEEVVKFWNDVHGILVPLEDFFPGDVFVAPGDIQAMDDCAWRQVMTFDQFKNEFGDHPDADLVDLNGTPIGFDLEGNIIFYEKSSDVSVGEVEIIRLFNKMVDEYLILANGIWINPQGNKTVRPLPFNHKKLPFWAAVFEPLDAMFFYGKSLGDKMISDQDTDDKVLDGILDRITMALHAPIVTIGNVSSGITEGYLEPDNVISIDEPTGLEKIERLDLGEPGMASFKVLEILAKRIEQTSVAPEVIGSSGGTNKTATQVSIEREGALQLVSLFLQMMEFGARDKYELRLANIFQFYSMADKKDKKFRTVVLRNEIVNDGKIGTMQLSFTDQPRPPEQLRQEAQQSFEEVEKIEITRDFIRNFEAEIKIVAQSSVKQTEALRQAQEINFSRVLLTMFPELTNKEVLMQDLVAQFPNKDFRRLKIEQPANPIAGVMGSEEEAPEIPTGEPSLRELVG